MIPTYVDKSARDLEQKNLFDPFRSGNQNVPKTFFYVDFLHHGWLKKEVDGNFNDQDKCGSRIVSSRRARPDEACAGGAKPRWGILGSISRKFLKTVL